MATHVHAVDPRTGRPASVRGGIARRRRRRVDAAAGAAATRACATTGARAEGCARPADRLRDRADELVAVCAETGLPEGRLRGELERTAGQLEAFADVSTPASTST